MMCPTAAKNVCSFTSGYLDFSSLTPWLHLPSAGALLAAPAALCARVCVAVSTVCTVRLCGVLMSCSRQRSGLVAKKSDPNPPLWQAHPDILAGPSGFSARKSLISKCALMTFTA